jgi:hypothetical protein
MMYGKASKKTAKTKAPAAGGMAKKRTMAKGPAAMPKMAGKKPGKKMR